MLRIVFQVTVFVRKSVKSLYFDLTDYVVERKPRKTGTLWFPSVQFR